MQEGRSQNLNPELVLGIEFTKYTVKASIINVNDFPTSVLAMGHFSMDVLEPTT